MGLLSSPTRCWTNPCGEVLTLVSRNSGSENRSHGGGRTVFAMFTNWSLLWNVPSGYNFPIIDARHRLRRRYNSRLLRIRSPQLPLPARSVPSALVNASTQVQIAQISGTPTSIPLSNYPFTRKTGATVGRHRTGCESSSIRFFCFLPAGDVVDYPLRPAVDVRPAVAVAEPGLYGATFTT